jgi:hypothetical protein
MKTPLIMEGEITEDGHLLVDLPPELPHGRVVVTLELVPKDDLELSDENLMGIIGLTAEEIALSPEIGAWSVDSQVQSGAEYVEKLRRASPRYSW